MRQTIGLIAGGFKPLTKGHWVLIDKASRECDKVHLIISSKDRARPGELPIQWEQMEKVWTEFIIPRLPGNVEATFSSAPIRNVMDILMAANAEEENYNTYFIYSDPVDIAANYPERAQKKYMNRLMANDQVVFRASERVAAGKGDAMISGTLMRKFLSSGDKKAFIAGLPGPVQMFGPEIYRVLGGR